MRVSCVRCYPDLVSRNIGLVIDFKGAICRLMLYSFFSLLLTKQRLNITVISLQRKSGSLG